MRYSDKKPKNSTKIYKFDDFQLNPLEKKLLKDGKNVEMTTKMFDVLELLVRKHGETVSKDIMFNEVWKDRFVEEGNIHVYVSKLRRILGASKKEPFIKTVSGVGYRFVAKVSLFDEYSWGHSFEESSKSDNSKYELSAGNTLAVLPLKNESGNQDIEYLADGITESLINKLSSNHDFTVMARSAVFHYKTKILNIEKLKAELGVTHILVGWVRLLNDKLMVGMELIKAEGQKQVWGINFNQPFEDIFKLQSKVTREISGQLSQYFQDKPIFNRFDEKRNTEPYILYLKGKFFLEKRATESLKTALTYFESSISMDKMNLDAYVGLADCCKWFYYLDHIALPEAKEKILHILQTLEELGKQESLEYKFIRAFLAMELDWDFRVAEKFLEDCIMLNGNHLPSRLEYCFLLAILGRHEEQVYQLKYITKLDPISAYSLRNQAWLLLFLGDSDSAIAKLREVIEMHPHQASALAFLGIILTDIGHLDEAMEVLVRSYNLEASKETLANLGNLWAKIGESKKVDEILRELENMSKREFVPKVYASRINGFLGNLDEAFNCLEDAYKQHCVDLISLRVDPRWKPLHNDTRFNRMVKKVGLV